MNRVSKYILTGFASLPLIFATTGCDDLFNEAPVDELAEPNIWVSLNLLDEYSLVWYHNLSNGFNIVISTNWLLRHVSKPYTGWLTDQITYPHAEWNRAIFAEEVTSEEEIINTMGSNRWDKDYGIIQHINRSLADVNEIADEAHKNRILGEAYFFRKRCYYQLPRCFGAPMFTQELYDLSNDQRRLPCSSYEEVVVCIVSEVDKVVNLPVMKSEPEDVGCVTKGVAIMSKAEAYSWVGLPVFQNKGRTTYDSKPDHSKEMV